MQMAPQTEKPQHLSLRENLKRFWQLMTEPHISVNESGARRQVRLAMILALMGTVLSVVGLLVLAPAMASGAVQSNLLGFGLLAPGCLLAYMLCRTRFHNIGGILLGVSVALTAFGAAFGSEDPAVPLFAIIPMALVIGGIFLPVRGLIALTVFNVAGAFLLPLLQGNPISGLDFRNAGLLLAMGVLLIVVTLFRNSLDKTRLVELQMIWDLQRHQTELETQLAERNQAVELARQDAEAARRAMVTQVWQTVGHTRLNDAMRGEQDILTLAHNVIRHLCRYLDAPLGAIFVMEGEMLTLVGGYAYIPNPRLPEQFKVGEGLVGQAAQERQMITLNKIPQDYVLVTSGLGDSSPRSLVICPFIYADQVIGVVEIGALVDFTPVQLEFIQQAMENIGIAFGTAQTRARINALLKETQRQAEEMRAQEEELRAANEELEAQAESLRASEGRLRDKQAELEALNAELEEKAAALQPKR